ncbi:MAG TPA: hypothetical protein VL309_11340 [Vicinamibacterales bacterium]|nr:hypothetical protein [Vicinamibacterales bacterium]
MKWIGAAAIACCGLLVTVPAAAQSQPRVTIGGGIEWMGSSGLGSAPAAEGTGSGGTLPLFTTASDLGASAGPMVKIGVRVTRRIEVEGSGSYLRPAIETRISGDTEGGPPVTATDRLRQFTVEGNVLYAPPRWRVHGAGIFLEGGAGYLRQLHEGDTLAASGRLFAGGAGVRLPLVTHSRGRLRVFGLRGDARAVVRQKAAALDGGTHLAPSLAISVFATF